MPGASDERRNELKIFFDSFDKNHNEFLEFNEFVKLVENLGAKISPEDLRKGFNKVDTDNNDLISFEEFVNWWGDL